MQANTQLFSLRFTSVSGASVMPYQPIWASGLSAWNDACQLISEKKYDTEYGIITITTDWSDARKCYEQSIYNNIAHSIEKDETAPEWLKTAPASASWGDVWKEHSVECKVTLPSEIGKTIEALRNMAQHYLSCYFYEFFLIMNLSSPGSCALQHTFFNEEFGGRSGLYGDDIESAWLRSIKEEWPGIGHIPLRHVVKWLNSFKIGARQIAHTRAEKAMYSLLHVCQSPRIEPSNLLWLAHALEALYDTPQESIIRSLKNRICSILSVPLEQERRVKRDVSRFYEVRSSFVHGSLPIAHPLENELLDPSIDEYRKDIADATDIGLLILVATLQKHIVNNWKEISFTEQYNGVPTGSTTSQMSS